MTESDVIINYNKCNFIQTNPIVCKLLDEADKIIMEYIKLLLESKNISISFTETIIYPCKINFRIIQNESKLSTLEIYKIITNGYKLILNMIKSEIVEKNGN
jgi:hypothetical protein